MRNAMRKRFCVNCGTDISDKRIDALYCREACRKYFKRHGPRAQNISNPLPALPSALPIIRPDKGGQVRTPTVSPPPRNYSRSNAGSDLAQTVRDIYRKGGDLGEALLGGALVAAGGILEEKIRRQLIPPLPKVKQNVADTSREPEKKPDKPKPLKMRTAQQIKEKEAATPIPLPDEWQDFLGSVVRPFKMLVWGIPGSGKSTFVLKLLDVLNATGPTLYISAEEPTDSTTLNSRIRRTMQSPERTLIIERLPITVQEWIQVGWDEEGNELRQAIAFDSLTALHLTPFDYTKMFERLLDEKIAGLSWEEAFTIYILARDVSLIWITHAYKDGKEYRGDSSWAYEADIVVKCEQGQAITLKNRFGEAGRSLQVY